MKEFKILNEFFKKTTFEDIFTKILTILTIPIYVIFQFFGDLFHALGRLFDMVAEGILDITTSFADFVLRRNK